MIPPIPIPILKDTIKNDFFLLTYGIRASCAIIFLALGIANEFVEEQSCCFLRPGPQAALSCVMGWTVLELQTMMCTG